MLTGRDIIIISSIEWDFNWQGHQEIARRLAHAGNRVLYVENMGVRTPRLHDAGRVVMRAGHWLQALPAGGVREALPGLHVCSPVILPPFGSAMRQRVNRLVLLPLIRHAVEKLNFSSEIILTYLPTDTVVSLIKLLRKPGGLTAYYCIADFAALTPYADAMIDSERAVIEMSDVVFAQCEQLAERCARPGKQVAIFPFGVNLDLFNCQVDSTHIELSDSVCQIPQPALISAMMNDLPRPIIGYVGGIHRHFDTEMLAAMARARPDWSWVLIGPVQTALNGLRRMQNVHLVGPKPHQELPEYIGNMDVGIVPYLRNEYTMTVVPTKINEYLAMGKPVVSTDLPEVRAFDNEHKVLVISPGSPMEFLASIEGALRLPSADAIIAHRREVAALSDWDMRIERMSSLLEEQSRAQGDPRIATRC